MRLTAFKAQGFKSFADPVSFKTGGGLIGVVGPNGCGKSNIVDAIRWVLGESRAASLRGNMLADVLFNGSDSRPPSDWCSVRLHFQNEGEARGTLWENYPEIIITRELSRDGDQNYTINDIRVRRRDVIDLFRGTGVSPRAYGVVEQGMVSQIAEAGPEELRAFMEEAAGVSHYKDRRRESERRIQSSRENLQHLLTGADTLRKQSSSLSRQQKTAQRYQKLTEEIRHLEALSILSRRRGVREDLQKRREAVAATEGEITAVRKTLEEQKRRMESLSESRRQQTTKTESARQKMDDAQKAIDLVQRDMDNLAEIRNLARARHDESRQEAKDLEKRATDIAAEHLQLTEDLAQIETAVADSQQKISAMEGRLEELRAVQENDRQAVESLGQQQTNLLRRLETEKVRQRMVAEKIEGLDKRLQEAKDSLTELDAAPPKDDNLPANREQEEEIHILNERLQQLKQQRRQAAEAVETADATVRRLENEYAALMTEMNTLSRVLQEDGEWKTNSEERLAHVFRANAGDWARALDTALGSYATARIVDDLRDFVDESGLPPPGHALIEKPQNDAPPPPARDFGLPALLSLIDISDEGSKALTPWLQGVYAAETAAQAMAHREQLGDREKIISKDGFLFTPHSLSAHGEVKGGYDWEEHHRQLAEQCAKKKEALSQAREFLETQRTALKNKESEEESISADLQSKRQLHTERQIAQSRAEERRQAAIARRQELEQHCAALQAEHEGDDALHRELSASIAHLQGEEAGIRTALTEAQSALDATTENVSSNHRQWETLTAHRHDWALRQREIKQRLSHLQATREETEERRKKNQAIQNEEKRALQRTNEETLTANMQEKKTEWQTARTEFLGQREALTKMEEEHETLEQRREKERAVLENRQQKINEERLKEHELAFTEERLLETLDELALDEATIAEWEAEALNDERDWKEEMEEKRQKRDRLGAINHAADNDLRECLDKLAEVETQQNDIETAIADLEEAIKRIDGETKKRLSDAYEAINREFGILAKRFFGGGEASLEMTGNSVLESGFELKVRPPGKRISSIRMLSGGEKAAAAAAFVFAIIKLNPPPFCILDEVDAPLDDQRSQRFIDILQEITQTVQCLVVTHNKGTVSSIPSLIGVTQEEAGVSKIVSVSLSDALRNAQ